MVPIALSMSALSQGSPTAAHARDDGGVAARAADDQVSVLRAAVGVVDHARRWLATGDGHRDRVGDQLGFERVAHRSADQFTAVTVRHARQEQPALVSGDIRDVGHPLLVRPGGGEVPLEMVGRRRCSPIRDRGAHTLAASTSALDAQLAHQPGGSLLPDPDAPVDPQPGSDPRSAVGVTAPLVERQDLRLQLAGERMVIVASRRSRPAW
jgi:hypothetical protein